MAPRLTHLAMHVQAFDACVAFYRDVCAMRVVHERGAGETRVVWLAESGRDKELVFVLIPGGPRHEQASGDFSHIGFAVESRDAVDAIADRARADGSLVWEPREEPHPVGYYCGLRDPDGRVVEISFGQPLGPGAPAT